MDNSAETIVDDMITKQPLILFSLYTAIQAGTIERIGNEICEISSRWPDDYSEAQRAYDLFWLWIFGSYELLRTMDAFNSNFSPALREKVKKLKIEIAKLRMPFAKQELRGTRKTVYDELSVCELDKGIIFNIQGEKYNSTTVIERVIHFLHQITPEDLGKLGESPFYRKQS